MQEKQEKPLTITTLIFVALAVIFFAWAAVDFVQELVFLHNSEKVIGTVTDIAISTTFQDQQTWTDFCPVIKFQSRDGRTHEYDSQTCDNPAAYKVGQKVPVFYDPHDPTDVQMQNWLEQESSIYGPIILGLLFAVIGAFLFYTNWSTRRQRLRTRALGQWQK